MLEKLSAHLQMYENKQNLQSKFKKWIINVNVKCKTVKLLKVNLSEFRFVNEF